MRSGRPRWGQVQTLFKAKIALSFPYGEHSIPWLLDEGDIILALRQLLRQDSLVMLGFSLLSVKRNLSGGRTRFLHDGSVEPLLVHGQRPGFNFLIISTTRHAELCDK